MEKRAAAIADGEAAERVWLVEHPALYTAGTSAREGDLLDLGVTKNILEKSGTWISYKGERLGQGRENARIFLKEHEDIRNKIEQELRKSLGLIPANSSNGDHDETKKPAEAEKPNAMAAAAGAAKNRPNR